MAAARTIDAGLCERLITAATSHCQAAVPVPIAPAAVRDPNFDSISASLTSLSTAFVWGSILLALVVIALAAGWGYLVRGWAKDEAKTVARNTMQEWLTTEAPQIIREAAALLKPTGGDIRTDAEKQADELGEVS